MADAAFYSPLPFFGFGVPTPGLPDELGTAGFRSPLFILGFSGGTGFVPPVEPPEEPPSAARRRRGGGIGLYPPLRLAEMDEEDVLLAVITAFLTVKDD